MMRFEIFSTEKLIKSFSLFVLRIVLFCPRLTAFLSVGRHLLIQSWTHQLTISQVGWRHSISASVKCFHFMLILRVSNHTFLSKLSGIMFPKVPFQVFLHSGVEMFFIFLHLVWSGFGLIIISIFLNWNWIQSHVIQAFNNNLFDCPEKFQMYFIPNRSLKIQQCQYGALDVHRWELLPSTDHYHVLITCDFIHSWMLIAFWFCC